jgi:predicted dehydrogenase
MGIHNHMSEPLRLYKEWYDAGLLGPVREVHAWTDRPWWPYGMNDYAAPLPVPETLDWESWINTAEFRAYGEGYHPTLWRSWWEFGSGTIGDMGCHLLDLPFYMFNLGQPGRVEVVEIANGTEIAIPSGAHIVFHFPAGTNHGPLAVHWYEGFRMVDGKKQMFRPALPGAVPPDTKLSPNGRLIVCEKGVMYSDHVRFNTPIIFPEGEFDRWRNENLLPPKTLPRGRGNIRAEWVDAIFNGRPELASAGFDYSAPLTEATLVGNLAIRSGKSLGWDPAAMRATDNDPANTFIKPAFRSGWVTDRFQFV